MRKKFVLAGYDERNHRQGKRCKRCGKQFYYGWTGVKGLCDKCANVKRDPTTGAIITWY